MFGRVWADALAPRQEKKRKDKRKAKKKAAKEGREGGAVLDDIQRLQHVL